jgi:hypothetical protein
VAVAVATAAGTIDQVEVARLREAAERELTNVTPIRTAFHFFVAENVDEVRLDATKEVQRIVQERRPHADAAAVDPYLLNSNLNSRLMKRWEDLAITQRDAYYSKEEDDRERFQQEDEVAARHCATLTARLKSPQVPTPLAGDATDKNAEEPISWPESSATEEMKADRESASKTRHDDASHNEESPPKKVKQEMV